MQSDGVFSELFGWMVLPDFFVNPVKVLNKPALEAALTPSRRTVILVVIDINVGAALAASE